MLLNYLKIAFRTFRRFKLYSIIKVAGLGVGIACSVLMLLLVRSEWSYDRFHVHADHLYRVNLSWRDEQGALQQYANVPGALGPALQQEFPELEAVSRLHGRAGVAHRGAVTFEEHLTYVDPAFLQMFSFPLLQGDPARALADRQGVVLTERAAAKYFGDEDPMGRQIDLRLGNRAFESFTVTGVVRNPPANSSITFEVLLPYARLADDPSVGQAAEDWHVAMTPTFVRLREGIPAAAVERALAALKPKYDLTVQLQPITDIYLNRAVMTSGATRFGHPGTNYLMLSIALLILATACINFTTLSVAHSAQRFREVGVRRTVGAGRAAIMRQFWGEALLTTLLATALGLALAQSALPLFNGLVERELAFAAVWSPSFLVILAGLVLLVGLLAGGYPALYLSRLRPVQVLRDGVRVRGSNRLTRLLVVMQCAFSIVLLSATLVMFRQLGYMREADLGFTPEDVLVVDMDLADAEARVRFRRLLEQEAERAPSIVGLAGSRGMVLRTSSSVAVEARGRAVEAQNYAVGRGFVETLGFRLAAGQPFTPETGVPDEVLIDEALAAQLGLADPVGRQVTVEGRALTVVGVLEAARHRGMRYASPPLVLLPAQDFDVLAVRHVPGGFGAALAVIDAAWQAAVPDAPYYAYALQEGFRDPQDLARLRKAAGVATALALLIACLGLFGLSAQAAVRRTKEIGIRKVCGASVLQVAGRLAREFVVLVLVAGLLAAPVAHVVAVRWLENFAHHVTPGPAFYLLAGVLALVPAVLSVSYHAVRAALANPVEALRYE